MTREELHQHRIARLIALGRWEMRKIRIRQRIELLGYLIILLIINGVIWL